jgi:hypothetical protein
VGNMITNLKAPDQPYLQISNGGMSVLIATLVLSGSDRAVSPWEQACVTWLAQRDQSVFGAGMVGFDIDDLAWSRVTFAKQHAFVLQMIDGATNKQRWDVLDYDPPFAQADLYAFHRLVEQYRVDYVEADKEWQWWAQPEQFVKCPQHQVYMHASGCVICNDC